MKLSKSKGEAWLKSSWYSLTFPLFFLANENAVIMWLNGELNINPNMHFQAISKFTDNCIWINVEGYVALLHT